MFDSTVAEVLLSSSDAFAFMQSVHLIDPCTCHVSPILVNGDKTSRMRLCGYNPAAMRDYPTGELPTRYLM
jgi:hypothetical protein